MVFSKDLRLLIQQRPGITLQKLLARAEHHTMLGENFLDLFCGVIEVSY